MNLINRLIKDEEGQGLVEYSLIIGLIAIVAVAAITATGTSITGIWDRIAKKLDAIVLK